MRDLFRNTWLQIAVAIALGFFILTISHFAHADSVLVQQTDYSNTHSAAGTNSYNGVSWLVGDGGTGPFRSYCYVPDAPIAASTSVDHIYFRAWADDSYYYEKTAVFGFSVTGWDNAYCSGIQVNAAQFTTHTALGSSAAAGLVRSDTNNQQDFYPDTPVESYSVVVYIQDTSTHLLSMDLSSTSPAYPYIFLTSGNEAISGSFTFATTSADLSYNTVYGLVDTQTSCDSASGILGYSICKILVFLFVPQSSTLTQYATLIDKYQHKPPIGYFYTAYDLIGSFATTSTTTIDMTQQSSILSVFAAPLYTGLQWIIWIGILVWAFWRITHFNFHA